MRDIPHIARTVGPWTFLKRIYNQSFFEDNLLVWASALAFSWLLALFPFLIFCLSLVPFLPDGIKPSEQTILESIEEVLVTGESISEATEEVREEIASPQVEQDDPDQQLPMDGPTTVPAVEPGTDPDEVPAEDVAEAEEGRRPAIISQTVTSLVTRLIYEKPYTWSLIAWIAVALFTASGGVAMTIAGLDECYDVAPDKIRPLWKSRPMAMLLTIVLAILILLAVIILPIGGRVISAIAEGSFFGIEAAWVTIFGRPLRWTVGLLLLLASVSLMYRFGPSVRTRLHLFSPGSVFTVGMWILTAVGFQFYVTSFGAADTYARTYGAVGGVAILMLLFYLDALFLLIGAEINAEIDFIRLGIKSGPLPEEQETAPIPPYQLDEEDRELKAELEEHRSIDLPPAKSRTVDESVER
jgi:YihY family inner membrane protein